MFTPQAPIGSGFGAFTTAADIIKGVELAGKTIVVTGGYSGIGVETVRAFRSAGAKVIVPARDMAKAKRNLADMPDVGLEPMDLLDAASIDALAERFLGRHEELHILVNNAGSMGAPLTRDARGYESQFAGNHLGHFQLTCRLWPALVRAKRARVIALSSYGHRLAGVDFHDPNFERRAYDPWMAYGQAKTANALFAVALDAIGQRQGVRAFSVHPGGVVTDLVRHMPQDRLAASGHIDKDGKADHRPREQHEDRRTGRRDKRVVRDQPAAGRHGWGLLHGLRGRACASKR
jgi:NAD(P)-dependent dehydrogenase (short-subunit alcohol dehydrogenase family)